MDGDKGNGAVGVAPSPPDIMEARSSWSRSVPSERWRIKGGGAIPSLDCGLIDDGYPQGLNPESLLSSDFCRDMEPRPRPPPPGAAPGPRPKTPAPGGSLPAEGGIGLPGIDLPESVGVPANDMAFENRLDIVEVAGLRGF